MTDLHEHRKRQCSNIATRCAEAKIDPKTAAELMSDEIRVVMAVQFRERSGNRPSFRIRNHQEWYVLNPTGYARSEMERVYGLAVALYVLAQHNGSVQPGEVHISDNVSTKHHRTGIEKYRKRYNI